MTAVRPVSDSVFDARHAVRLDSASSPGFVALIRARNSAVGAVYATPTALRPKPLRPPGQLQQAKRAIKRQLVRSDAALGRVETTEHPSRLPGWRGDRGSAASQVLLGLPHKTLHDLAGRLDLIDEPAGLAKEQRAGIDVANLTRTAHSCGALSAAAAQLPFAPNPLLYEPVATDAQVRAGKDATRSDVGDLG